MAQAEFEIEDLYGNKQAWTNIAAFASWIETEAEAWSWVKSAPHKYADVSRDLVSRFGILKSWVDDLANGRMSEQDFRVNVRGVYATNPPQLLLSDAWPGLAVQKIKFSFSTAEAEWVLAWLITTASPDLSDVRQLRLWQAAANPSLIEGQAWLEEQRTKISSARQVARRTLERQKDEYQSEIDALRGYVQRDRKRLRKVFGRFLKIRDNRILGLERRGERQIDLIQDTRAAFEEQMRLKAPVEYWADKRHEHMKSAVRWLIALGHFVLLSALGVGMAFRSALDAVGDQNLSGRHVLIIAGMGTLLTFMFWMAKLIVRIYLGERHLATDAEERRVMTQAYLALINESAASPDERVVILSSLFKTAQDGIVKDDGSAEFSLPAILASALAGKGMKT